MSHGYGGQREPTESSDPMYVEDKDTPVCSEEPQYSRREIPSQPAVPREDSSQYDQRKVTHKDASESSNTTQQKIDELPHLIDDVIIEDKQSFPPRDFTGNEGSSVDHTSPMPTEHEVEPPGTGTQPPIEAPKPKLRRKTSSLSVSTITLPKINCPEKIFLCVDHSAEMFVSQFRTQSANKTSAFKTLTNAIKQFVCTKSFLNKKHQFSLIMMNEDAQLITDFSSNYEELLYMLNDIADSPHQDGGVTQQKDYFDLTNLFNVIKQQAGLPRVNMKQAAKIPPPFIVRAIVIYGRSDCHPKFHSGHKSFHLLNNSPFFFVDSVYIHKTPDPEDEDPEGTKMKEIMDIFAEMCALDARGSSHIHEVGTDSNIASLYNIFAKLLAHPLQRPKQGENPINYNLEPE